MEKQTTKPPQIKQTVPAGKNRVTPGQKYFLAKDVWHIDTMNQEFWIVNIRDTQVKVKPEELVLVEGF